jgi:hypothetical protein
MATIELHGLSMQEAEAVVAEIWGCLEEYQIPSPDLTVAVDARGHVSVGCRFRERVWMQVVATRLSTWVTASNLGKARSRRYRAEIGRPWRFMPNHGIFFGGRSASFDGGLAAARTPVQKASGAPLKHATQGAFGVRRSPERDKDLVGDD